MRFLTLEETALHLRGRKVAVVGSGPSVLDNVPGLVDGHDVVVRISNYKTGSAQGVRTDVFYSFFGTSIRKTATELQRDGVKLCMCKCPNSKPLQSEWHERTGRVVGIDYRYIYVNRQGWWFCDTFVPDNETFLKKFRILENHIPTTGFAAILDVLACDPSSVYLTGFDFFSSGVHNVNEPWKPGCPDDPIRHMPELEAAWLKANAKNYPITLDRRLQELLA